MNKFAYLAILLTILWVVLGIGIWILDKYADTLPPDWRWRQDSPETRAAKSLLTALNTFGAITGSIWAISAFAGVIVLLRKGYLARVPVSCLLWGLFVLLGWWLIPILLFIIALPGPFLLQLAESRKPKPRCPSCKSWNVLGATKCAHCGSDIPTVDATSEPVTTSVPPTVRTEAVSTVEDPNERPQDIQSHPLPTQVNAREPMEAVEVERQTYQDAIDLLKEKLSSEKRKKVQWNMEINGVQVDAVVNNKRGYMFAFIATAATDLQAWKAADALDELFVIAWRSDGARYGGDKGGIYILETRQKTCKWIYSDDDFQWLLADKRNVKFKYVDPEELA